MRGEAVIVTEYRVLVPDWVRPDQWKQVAAEMRKLGGVYSHAARCKAWHMPGGFVFCTAEEAAVAVQRLEKMK